MDRLLPFYVDGAKHAVFVALGASLLNAVVLFTFAAAVTLGVKVVL